MNLTSFIINALVSLTLGILIALVHSYKNNSSRNFLLTLASLPILVQVVISLVNGNLGTGVAVMGAFSIIRFRSVAGGAREILSVFWAMSIGLATGTSQPLYACLFSVITAVFIILLEMIQFKGFSGNLANRRIKITIAEDLDIPHLFDDIFKKYSHFYELENVKTTQMGSLYELRYHVKMKDLEDEKDLLDEIRIRNGNLPVSSAKVSQNAEVL
ncbi:MAG: DUF4956 domain-containing protein [Lactovum sp.]